MNAVRRVVHAENPDQPVFGMQTVERILDAARWPYRIFGSMFAIVAVGSLLLSAVGLYAVMAYAVSRRRHEIGVRMAVGANRAQVSWMILERGLGQLAVGVPLGLAGAVGLGAVLNNLLVDMTPADPLTLAGVAGLLTMVAIGACLLPARRATRVDPLVVLRAE
jgi:putative ABC transport system permease protein